MEKDRKSGTSPAAYPTSVIRSKISQFLLASDKMLSNVQP